MGFLLRFLAFCLRVLIGGAVIGFAAVSLFGLLGIAFPLADVFNHFLPVWAAGLAVSLLLALLFLPTRFGRRPILGFGIVGLIAAGMPLAFEFVRASNAPTTILEKDNTLRIATRNLFGRNYDMERVAEAIRADGADIVALQEYFTEQSSGLHDRIVDDYPHYSICAGGKRAAIAIYSKLPFVTTELSVCPAPPDVADAPVGRIIAEFELDNGELFTVVTTHLNWPVRVSVLRRSNRSWMQRIADMTARKENEWSDLRATVADIDTPMVLLGDLNSTPWSFALRRFEADSGLERKSLNLPTYPSHFYIRGWRDTSPIAPLDHIFVSDGIAMDRVQTSNPAGSDHLALVADFSVQASDRLLN